MNPFFRSLVPAILLSGSVLLAAPKIEFDKTTFDCGTVAEGKVEKLNASFTVKNTGDAVLKIDNVRPGCGCTVVKFDTNIAPGKTGLIQSTVNIANYHSGSISKGVTVTSNAANISSQQLTISAFIQGSIDLSETYLTLSSGKPQSAHVLYLASAKKDLVVSDVTFKSSTSGLPQTGTAWQNASAVSIQFKWIPTDSTRAEDKYRIYKLEVGAPAVSQQLMGDFVLKTNHADKREIVLHGSLDK
jgi:lipoprotein-anchoring transpeptidase ErfK/SrfK